MSSSKLGGIIENFKVLTDKPVKFLTIQEDAQEDIKILVKSLYDFTKSQENNGGKSKSNALSDLIVTDFDEEQIWQQIELQNTECWDGLVWNIANSAAKSDLQFPVEEAQDLPDDAEKDIEESEQSENEENEDNDDEEEYEAPRKKEVKQKSSVKASVVDDQFFKLKDMEKFLINEDKKDGKPQRTKDSDDDDDESVDMFDEIDSEGADDDEGGKDCMYNDFFNDGGEDEMENDSTRKKKNRKVTFADAGSETEPDDEDDDDQGDDDMEDNEDRLQKGHANGHMSNEDKEDEDSAIKKPAKDLFGKPTEKVENKSEFELRQERLQQTITRLEDKTLADAPWQLRGEVNANIRPQNSLLQEVVDFDMTSRPPPIITEETTLTLEEIIRQRVKDKAWDDVIRKAKPVEDVLAFRKAEVLEHAKSKQSLAEVYEAEYLKQKHASTDDNDNEKEPESHTQIREAMTSLFSKLDALAHYHYTPKAAQPEVKIIGNTPAISMEEVAPVATSDAALLAPQEIKKKSHGELMSKEERTTTDKKRERRKKKQFQKEKGQVAKVTEQRNTKKSEESNDKSLKTSKAFFQQLNDNSTSLIKNNSKRNVKNKGQ